MSEVGKPDIKPAPIDYVAAYEILARRDLLDAVAEAVARERVAREAALDERTGLPLPALARRQADEILGRVGSNRLIDPISAIAFKSDIVGFGDINAKKGWDSGNKYLKSAADFFRSAIRDTDILSRWGGDEFIILAPVFQGMTDDEMVEIVQRRLQKIPQTADFPRQIRWDCTTYRLGDNLEKMLSRIDVTTDEGKKSARYSDLNQVFSLT